MSSKGNYSIILFIISSLVTNLLAQTTDWKVLWNRNPQTDNVDRYLLYRQISSAPTNNSLLVSQTQEPTSQSQDTVMYVDGDIEPGIHYFYAVQAVNADQLSSALSIPVSAAIPKILFPETIVLKADTTYLIPLNNGSYVDDPDHDPTELVWSLSGSNQINGSINPSNNNLTIVTPADTTVSATFQFTVTDPDEFYDNVSMTITLTEGAPPPPPPPPPPPDEEVEKVVAYPVPYVGSEPPPCDCINFQFPTSLNARSLLIYSVMGDLVFSVTDLPASFDWAVVNSNGIEISPGLYIYYIQNDSGAQVASGKVVIIK